MKSRLLKTLFMSMVGTSAITALQAQAPSLGATSSFVFFSTNGAVKNTAGSQVTGNVGTNNGSNTGFGNVNGVMHSADSTTGKCAADLLIAYNQLDKTNATLTHAPLLGGDTLKPGVYAVSAASSLNGILTLDGGNVPDAVFIFKINGSFSTAANSKIRLIGRAQACNVFWKVEGLVDMASNTTMRGTLIANNAGINMAIGDTLEGRAFSTTGAITIGGLMANAPIGCGSKVLAGPNGPNLGSAACYAIFSTSGSVSNSGVTLVTGDIGTNLGLTTGYDASVVQGKIHPKPDASTAAAAADLHNAYVYLNTLPYDINLLFPDQFGSNLVLTPHTYLLNAATTLTGQVILNGQGNSNAVFVIQVNGAFSSVAGASVVLANGTQEKNVFWKIEGAVNLSTNTNFTGTIISNAGAVGTLNTGVVLHGRALTTGGAISTSSMSATTVPSSCFATGLDKIGSTEKEALICPNPCKGTTTLWVNNASSSNTHELCIYSVIGALVMNRNITEQNTLIDVLNLPAGIYYYKLSDQSNRIQTGKFVTQ